MNSPVSEGEHALGTGPAGGECYCRPPVAMRGSRRVVEPKLSPYSVAGRWFRFAEVSHLLGNPIRGYAAASLSASSSTKHSSILGAAASIASFSRLVIFRST